MLKFATYIFFLFFVGAFQQDHVVLLAKQKEGATSKQVLNARHLSITWDTSSLQRISPADSAGSYPRLIQLKNGSLLAAYESVVN